MMLPLIDSEGTDLFPELTSRLDKVQRRGVHIVMRDHPDKGSSQYQPFKRCWFSEFVPNDP